MLGNHRSGEISYYEELGVSEQATAEEIRDAFRALARMMHPDQQTDPHLKEIAERQMRKLNRIYSVLSDPERRRRYDEVFDGLPTALMVRSSPHLAPRQLSGQGIWMGAALVGMVLLGLFWWDSANTQQNRPREAVREIVRDAASPAREAAEEPQTGYDSLPGRADTRELARLRADVRALEIERDAAIRELDNLRSSRASRPDPGASLPSVARSAPPAPLASGPELPAIARPAVIPARTAALAATAAPVHSAQLPVPGGAAAERKAPPGLAGFWFYVKPAMGQENKNQELYPPEFIEATIVEENGMVKGKYRSRFQIVDRAISPDVNFTFHGPAGSAGPFSWVGAGGARGELTLKLTSENQLRVEWSASELGSQQGLVSGTAVLKRRLE